MNSHADKAVAFATAQVTDAAGKDCVVELAGEHEDWTESRLLHTWRLRAWSRASSVSMALSPNGTIAGWMMNRPRTGDAAPKLTDDQIESRARFLARQFREDSLVGIERAPAESGGAYAVARFAAGWVAIRHGDGSLVGHMPIFGGEGRPVAADDATIAAGLETAWGQLEKDLSRELDSDELDHLRDTLRLSVGDVRQQDRGVTQWSLVLWSYYSTIEVAIESATGDIVRWHVEAFSEPAGGDAGDEAAAVRAAQPLLPDHAGVHGPSVDWEEDESGRRHAVVQWWHAEDEINVEGDHVTALVNAGTARVFSFATKWRQVPLPRLQAASRVSSARAQALADQEMAATADRFQLGELLGLSVIEVMTDAAETTRVIDRLVWRVGYLSPDAVEFVEISVDCETGQIVRTTGW